MKLLPFNLSLYLSLYTDSVSFVMQVLSNADLVSTGTV